MSYPLTPATELTFTVSTGTGTTASVTVALPANVTIPEYLESIARTQMLFDGISSWYPWPAVVKITAS